MKLRALVTGIGIIAAIGLLACGDKGKDKLTPEEIEAAEKGAAEIQAAKAAEAAEAASGGPSLEEVAKLDCGAACATQLECARKAGMNIDDEVAAQRTNDCVQSCEMIISPDIYKPDVHGKTAATFLVLAGGDCG